jgi:electron transport complex protein RnfC
VISRVVTVTGNVAKPQNFDVLIGTPIREVVALAGGVLPDTERYIVGGPMMGFDLPSLDAPLMKSVNCLIAASNALFPPAPPAMPCIRCGKCALACPADLQPFELYWFAQSQNVDKARAYKLFDCIECGCCSYVCPSSIPLVSYYRFAKSEIALRDREHRAAEIARERYEFKQARIEREKQERAAMLAQKQAAVKTAAAADPAAEAKKAAIQAAMERVKAQQQAARADRGETSQESEKS